MKTIEIDDDVYSALAHHVQGFNESPNDVIGRLIQQTGIEKVTSEAKPQERASGETKTELEGLIESAEFRRLDAIGRYLAILESLYHLSPATFEKLGAYRRKGGRRVNFSRQMAEIEKSGNSTGPQKIPRTPFYVLTNLDNRSKRKILGDILPEFGFKVPQISAIQKALPDQTRH